MVSGKQNGVPLVKGTRIPAQQIVEEHELGSSVEYIAENFPSITRDQINTPVAYALKLSAAEPQAFSGQLLMTPADIVAVSQKIFARREVALA